jgi:hypothetical protein
MIEMVFPEDFEERLASLHLSMMRVAKATTFRASTSSTSHITIVGLNIVDPFRTFSHGGTGFLEEANCLLLWIPLSPMPSSLYTCVTYVLFHIVRSAVVLRGGTNRMRDLLMLCLQRVESRRLFLGMELPNSIRAMPTRRNSLTAGAA